jgi:glycerol-3-phosphate dehydrogenase
MRPDVVVVGGGIQGVTMALAAARKGLQPLLVERAEIASGATGNSYGIIHGGLRYLQTLDLPRWRRSRRAQSWYLNQYPQFTAPLPCLMPLYKRCFRSPAAFRAAGALEAILYGTIGGEPPLPRLQFLSVAEVLKTYRIPPEGLNGAALWYDAQITDLEGLMSAMLEEAGVKGDRLLTNCEAIALSASNGQTTGVRVRDLKSGGERVVESNIVINCAGSWVNRWNDRATGPSTAALAFNVLLDMPFPGDAALAVSERPGRGRSYFLRPQDGKTFAGTYYRAAPSEPEPAPTGDDVHLFLQTLDRALPGHGIADTTVIKVMPGLLPDADGRGETLSSRDIVVSGKPRGFHTVLGGKLTTAPLLSLDIADRIWPDTPATKRAT